MNLGHVLGLPDRYFTTWNNETCTYTVEQNTGDLMSSSVKGVVTKDSIEKLQTSY